MFQAIWLDTPGIYDTQAFHNGRFKATMMQGFHVKMQKNINQIILKK